MSVWDVQSRVVGIVLGVLVVMTTLLRLEGQGVETPSAGGLFPFVMALSVSWTMSFVAVVCSVGMFRMGGYFWQGLSGEGSALVVGVLRSVVVLMMTVIHGVVLDWFLALFTGRWGIVWDDWTHGAALAGGLFLTFLSVAVLPRFLGPGPLGGFPMVGLVRGFRGMLEHAFPGLVVGLGLGGLFLVWDEVYLMWLRLLGALLIGVIGFWMGASVSSLLVWFRPVARSPSPEG